MFCLHRWLTASDCLFQYKGQKTWAGVIRMIFAQACCYFCFERAPGDILMFWQDVIYYSCYRKKANKRCCLCAKHFGRNANAAAQSSIRAAHSWWGMICVCMRCSTAGFYTPAEGKCSPCTSIPPCKTIHEESWRSWLSFLSMNVRAPLSASGELNYLCYIGKELLRDTTTIKMALSMWHKHTHTKCKDVYDKHNLNMDTCFSDSIKYYHAHNCSYFDWMSEWILRNTD